MSFCRSSFFFSFRTKENIICTILVLVYNDTFDKKLKQYFANQNTSHTHYYFFLWKLPYFRRKKDVLQRILQSWKNQG